LNKYSPKVDASITVAAPIAERYHEEFGLDPIVIMNAPEKATQFPQMAINSPIKLIHHGAASSIRHPELMLETIALCDERYSLHFMFLHNEFVDELKNIAEKLTPGRVFFHDPVLPENIVHKISEFDVGIYILPPTNYNNLVALPNKFLDFICAGIAVCIGPSPAMGKIVKEYGVGVVCDTFDPKDMASLLNKISSEQWVGMKKAARIASDELNAAVEMKKLVNIYDDLFQMG
jgi:glycosyltransferase involved in cell wall biosynthesis